MISNDAPCHPSCSELLQEQLRDAVSKIHGNSKVETIVFEDHTCPPDTQAKENADGTFTHRFMVTIVEQCPEETGLWNNFQNNQADGVVDVHDISSLDELLEGSDSNSTLWEEAFVTPPRSSSSENVENEVLGEFVVTPANRGDSIDLPYFTNLIETGAFQISSDNADAGSAGLFPLTTEVLHETINEQLDKETPPTPAADLSNTLFKDISASCAMGMEVALKDAATNQDQTPVSATVVVNKLALSQQQQSQSNEITSSTWAHCQTTMIPQIISQDYFSSIGTSLALAGQNQVKSLALSSAKQQFLCPANLPAVSALIQGGATGGSSMNWTLSCVSSAGASKGTLVRLAKKAQQKQDRSGSSRPSMLLPKTATIPLREPGSPTKLAFSPVKAKLRSRKTNPTTNAPTDIPATGSQFPNNRPGEAPAGHTYASWIIQEGLLKARQKQRQEKKAGSMQNSQRQNGKTRKAQKMTRMEVVDTPATGRENSARFQCPLCGKCYGSANGIKYHAENGHGPKQSFTCNICNKDYASRHGLAAHKRTHEIRAAAEALEQERFQQQQLKQGQQ